LQAHALQLHEEELVMDNSRDTELQSWVTNRCSISHFILLLFEDLSWLGKVRLCYNLYSKELVDYVPDSIKDRFYVYSMFHDIYMSDQDLNEITNEVRNSYVRLSSINSQ